MEINKVNRTNKIKEHKGKKNKYLKNTTRVRLVSADGTEVVSFDLAAGFRCSGISLPKKGYFIFQMR
jgi:hypothetical protein